MLAEGPPGPWSAPIRASSKSIWGADMLTVENVDLKYGAAQVLWGVDPDGRARRDHLPDGPQRRGEDHPAARALSGTRPSAAARSCWDEAKISSRLPSFERARRGIAYVPQGREIFPLLTVKENLETGFAAIRRPRNGSVQDEVFELFPVLKTMLGRRGGDLSGGQQQQLAIGRAMVTRPDADDAG